MFNLYYIVYSPRQFLCRMSEMCQTINNLYLLHENLKLQDNFSKESRLLCKTFSGKFIYLGDKILLITIHAFYIK